MQMFRWFLVQLVVLLLLSIWSNTGYGASIGQDICYRQSTLLRTPKIPIPTSPGSRVICAKIPGPQPLTPISNPCYCVNTQVTPAPVARVDVDLTATTPAPVCGYGNGNTEPTPFGQCGSAFCPICNVCGGTPSAAYNVVREPPGPTGIDEPANSNECCTDDSSGPPAVPADPVSVILAQAEANRCLGGVQEGRLTFGPVTVPKDAIPTEPSVPDVNEEGLYSLDKAIVELKTCKRYGQNAGAQASDADVLLTLEEDAQSDNDIAAGPTVNLPSYADVGYQTETPSCAPLIGGVPVPPATNPKPIIICDSYTNDNNNNYQSCSNNKICTCGKCGSSGKCSCGKCGSSGKCSCGKCGSSGKCSWGKCGSSGKCSCGKCASCAMYS